MQAVASVSYLGEGYVYSQPRDLTLAHRNASSLGL